MVQFYKNPKRNASQKRSAKHVLKQVTTGDLTLHNQVRVVDSPKTFVKGALPGEIIDAVVIESGKHSATALAHTVHQSASLRTNAHCKYALGHPAVKQPELACGGCVMGFADANDVLSLKQSSIATALNDRLGYGEAVWQAPIKSQIAYRRKVRLAVDARNPNKIKVGFRQLNGKQIQPIAQCVVCNPALQNTIAELSQCTSDWFWLKHIGHISLLETADEVVMACHAVTHLPQVAIIELIDFTARVGAKLCLNEAGVSQSDSWQSQHNYGVWQEPVWASPAFAMKTIDGDRYPVQVDDFVQVNASLNNAMVTQALHGLELATNDRVLDLFAGAGNFSLPIARRSAQVLAVEGVQHVVENAALSAVAQGFNNIQWLAGDLAGDECVAAINGFAANKVLLDPARAGADFILSRCDLSSVSHLVYVSCNPQSWLNDAVTLNSLGFSLHQVRLLDMFRATHHTELLSVWRK